jgi:tRNA (cytidine/uridine-2'-O-)-methyltransferase
MLDLKSIHVVLFQPEIPQNTGSIARTCAATGAGLHLIKPLGFSTDDRYLKRAGLDYWHLVDVFEYENFKEFESKYPQGNLVYMTKKAAVTYDRIDYSGDLFLIFGSESKGLPEEILMENKKKCFRIPLRAEARSLTLSNAVAIVVYEALRQNRFSSL